MSKTGDRLGDILYKGKRGVYKNEMNKKKGYRKPDGRKLRYFKKGRSNA